MPVKHSAHSIHSTGFGPVGVTRASFGSAPPCISVSQVLTFLRTGECGRYLKLAADGPGADDISRCCMHLQLVLALPS